MTTDDGEGTRTLAEVADDLEIPQHVLRFWETRFPEIRPLKRAGLRLYRPQDVALVKGIRRLLYGEGYTIRGAQRILKEQGVAAVSRLGDRADAPAIRDRPAPPAPPAPAQASSPPPRPLMADEAGPAHASLPAAPPPGTDGAMRGELETLLDDLLELKRLLDESR